ncbi:MAG: phosphate transport system substrate-binding protein [Zhongshania marina]|jgi:phosphate transport system substrate-binding protein
MKTATVAYSKLIWRFGCLAASAFLITGLTGCNDKAAGERAITQDTIIADGSSTVFPITKEAARRYMQKNDNADIRTSFSGTTAGFLLFCKGKSDISNASRAMSEAETADCKSNNIEYLALPLAMDSIAIVVNPKNKWADSISVMELNKLWRPSAEANVKTWKDIRDDWPDQAITLYGRGKNSGTYDYFTQEIVGQARSSRHDYTASEDEEFLANSIADDVNAIGFFGIGAYHRHWNELKLLPLRNASNEAIYPSLATVKDGSYTPLTRPLYLYINMASLSSKKQLKPFLQDYYQRLPSWIHFTGYMPLDDAQYQRTLNKLN